MVPLVCGEAHPPGLLLPAHVDALDPEGKVGEMKLPGVAIRAMKENTE